MTEKSSEELGRLIAESCVASREEERRRGESAVGTQRLKSGDVSISVGVRGKSRR